MLYPIGERHFIQVFFLWEIKIPYLIVSNLIEIGIPTYIGSSCIPMENFKFLLEYCFSFRNELFSCKILFLKGKYLI